MAARYVDKSTGLYKGPLPVCAYCKHVRKSEFSQRICGHKDNVKLIIDFVNGGTELHYYDCRNFNDQGQCQIFERREVTNWEE